MADVAGFTSISPRKYFAANMLGHLPCAVVMSFVGAYGLELPPHTWLLVAAISVAGILLWRQYGDRLEGLTVS